jgi:hypothetical protein
MSLSTVTVVTLIQSEFVRDIRACPVLPAAHTAGHPLLTTLRGYNS